MASDRISSVGVFAVEPSIQYATTPDGVSIAFYTLGQGMPLVVMPGDLLSQIQVEWQVPAWRDWHERLAQRRLLVRYDSQGTGLSDREAIEISIESQVLDLEAVVDRLGLDEFSVFSAQTSGPAGIAYAARYPERVRRLILWCTYARASDYIGSGPFQALLALMAKDWDLFIETAAHARLGWSEGEMAPQAAVLLRDGVTRRMMEEFVSGVRDVDVTHLLPQVKSPTLVLHRPKAHLGPYPHAARGLASQIPDARLSLLEGTSVAPYLGDIEAVLREMDVFLGEGEGEAVPPKPSSREIARPLPEPLSERELEVLRLLAAGMSNQDTARELVIAVGTVKTHINNIYGKLNVRSRTQAIARSRELNLLP